MSQRAVTWLILLVAALTAVSRLYFVQSRAAADADELALQQATYENVRSLVLDRYVRELNRDEQEKIFYGALSGMTASLDAHSQFLTPERYELLTTHTKGSFA